VTISVLPIESSQAAAAIMLHDWLRSRLTRSPVQRLQGFADCARRVADGFLDETVTRDWSDVLVATIQAGADCGGVLQQVLDWADEWRPRASATEAVVLAGDDMIRRSLGVRGWLDDLVSLFGRVAKVFA
jgi:hypothetical protein